MPELADTMNIALFSVGGTTITLGGLLAAIGVQIVGWWLSRRLRKLVHQVIAPRFHIHQSTAFALGAVVFYIGIALTIGFTLTTLGFDLSNLAIIAGALSVGIGLGLQNIANNFISGLILLFDRSIKVGDYVELANGLRGTISQIRVRSTIILTNDSVEVIVPNSQFLSDQVVNWTLSSDTRRFHVPFGVAYGSDVDRVVEVAIAAAKTLPFVILDDPERQPKVWFTAMGESSLDFTLLIWVSAEATLNPSSTLSDCTFALHRALVEADISIPFPQRDVYIKTMPGTLPARVEIPE